LIKISKAKLPEESNSKNKQPHFLYGLVDLEIKVPFAGDTVSLEIYLPEPAAADQKWYTWIEGVGWQSSDSYAVFNEKRDLIILTLQDGGPGDADGIADGIIVDPSGLASLPSQAGDDGDSSDGGSSGGGCFINSIAGAVHFKSFK
jgi:hypothetical protein